MRASDLIAERKCPRTKANECSCSKIKTMTDELISFDRSKKIVQKAISHINILKNSPNYTYVELNPITGRKHQLRKQLYNLGCPIVGDDK